MCEGGGGGGEKSIQSAFEIIHVSSRFLSIKYELRIAGSKISYPPALPGETDVRGITFVKDIGNKIDDVIMRSANVPFCIGPINWFGMASARHSYFFLLTLILIQRMENEMKEKK